MPKFNIDTKIDINFSEDQIKEILVEVIAQEMPEIIVEDINFVIKRNPTSVSASVDGAMKGFMSTAPEEKKVEEQPELEPEIADEKPEGEESENVSDFLNLD